MIKGYDIRPLKPTKWIGL